MVPPLHSFSKLLWLFLFLFCCFSVAKLCLTLCDPMEWQHARLLCPPLSTRVCWNSCPLTWWCYLTVSFCTSLFSFSVFPSIGIFSRELALPSRWPKYWSFSFSISPSSEDSGLISFRMDRFCMQSKGLSRVFSSTTMLKHHFFGA